MLSFLDNYTLDNPDEIAKNSQRLLQATYKKNLTREQVSEKAGVAVSNIVRFEQKGLISLKNLIGIAMALGYTSEIKPFFRSKILYHGGATTNPQEYQQEKST